MYGLFSSANSFSPLGAKLTSSVDSLLTPSSGVSPFSIPPPGSCQQNCRIGGCVEEDVLRAPRVAEAAEEKASGSLPLLAPALLPAVILGSVWTFNMFNIIYLVSGGEPDGSTEILISEAYRWAFTRGHRYGYASAYAVLIFFVLLGYSRLMNKVSGQKVL